MIVNQREELVQQPTRAAASPKYGLVVQGGGMRGIYSLGALAVLEEAGLSDSFTSAFGSSSGAINAAYFLAGQTREATKAYLRDLAGCTFINYWRPWKIFDIDYLIDHVVKKSRRLDVPSVLGSPTDLHVILTDYMTGKGVVVTSRQLGSRLTEALRATAAIPLLYGRKVRLSTGSYIDGGVADPLPFLRAVEQGCVAVLVIATVSPQLRRVGYSGWRKLLICSALAHYPAALRQRIIVPEDTFNRTMEVLQAGSGTYRRTTFLAIFPSDPTRLVARATTDRTLLEICLEMGRDDMKRCLAAVRRLIGREEPCRR
jgi:predicted patatin/cPLA2 family phospholipase